MKKSGGRDTENGVGMRERQRERKRKKRRDGKRQGEIVQDGRRGIRGGVVGGGGHRKMKRGEKQKKNIEK